MEATVHRARGEEAAPSLKKCSPLYYSSMAYGQGQLKEIPKTAEHDYRLTTASTCTDSVVASTARALRSTRLILGGGCARLCANVATAPLDLTTCPAQVLDYSTTDVTAAAGKGVQLFVCLLRKKIAGQPPSKNCKTPKPKRMGLYATVQYEIHSPFAPRMAARVSQCLTVPNQIVAAAAAALPSDSVAIILRTRSIARCLNISTNLCES